MRPYNSMEKGKKEEPTLSHLALCLVFLFFAEAAAQMPVNLDALVLLDAAVGFFEIFSCKRLYVLFSPPEGKPWNAERMVYYFCSDRTRNSVG